MAARETLLKQSADCVHQAPFRTSKLSIWRWNFADYAMLRVASVPTNVVEELRFAKTKILLDRYNMFKTKLEEGREHLSETLHAQVKLFRKDQTARRALINVRRSLYGLKLPSDRDLTIL